MSRTAAPPLEKGTAKGSAARGLCSSRVQWAPGLRIPLSLPPLPFSPRVPVFVESRCRDDRSELGRPSGRFLDCYRHFILLLGLYVETIGTGVLIA